MQCDMYNLFPAIGAVNATRKNFDYAMLPDIPPSFGSCPFKVAQGKVEPPDRAKGELARAALYMDYAYSPRYHLSASQKKLFLAWHNKFKVSPWECLRAKRIKALQGNSNPYIEPYCR